MLSFASWGLRAGPAAGLLTLLVCAPIASAQPNLGSSTDAVAFGPPINRAPVIESISARQVPGQRFRIWGHVSDETPGTCGVVITGAANGVAMCNSNGDFDAIFNVASPGTATATAGDGVQSGQSRPVALNNAAPTVSVTAVQGANNTWTFRGTVGDEAPEGLIVALSGSSGLNGTTATVQAGGAWTVTVTLPAGASGTVTATVTDWYGLTGVGYTYFG
jgi:hypothetical protein